MHAKVAAARRWPVLPPPVAAANQSQAEVWLGGCALHLSRLL